MFFTMSFLFYLHALGFWLTGFIHGLRSSSGRRVHLQSCICICCEVLDVLAFVFSVEKTAHNPVSGHT